MLAAMTGQDYAVVIGSIAAGIALVLGALTKLLVEIRATKGVAAEAAVDSKKAADAVYTSNGKSVGQLTEAAESERIVRIPEDNRTEEENLHLAEIPLPVRPQGPEPLDRRAEKSP